MSASPCLLSPRLFVRAVGRRLPNVLAILLLAAGSGAAQAQPAAVLLHVQDPAMGADWCDAFSPGGCSDLVGASSAAGPLEIDVFLDGASVVFPPTIYTLRVVLAWPGSWQYEGFTPCGDLLSNAVPGSAGLLVDLVFPDCPDPGEGFTFLGRLRIVAMEPGSMVVASAIAGLGCTNGVMHVALPGGRAEVGSPCGCAAQCDPLCTATWNPDRVVLTVPQGQSVETVVDYLGEAAGGGPRDCHAEFAATVPWLSAESVRLGEGHHEVRLRADTGSLEFGTYVGRVRNADPDCARCLEVELRVSDEVPVLPLRWGAVKMRYR